MYKKPFAQDQPCRKGISIIKEQPKAESINHMSKEGKLLS
jgi:hypothetical protein